MYIDNSEWIKTVGLSVGEESIFGSKAKGHVMK